MKSLSPISFALVLAIYGLAFGEDLKPPSPTTHPVGQVVQFKSGLRINYPAHQVEVDAKVCMRQGLLELFACSPNTREYESIIVVLARPLHVYQAMGLLGLTPGRPLRMLPTGEIEPASGQPLELAVAWDANGVHKEVPIEAWLRRAKLSAPLEQQTWVFAGSLRLDNGAIAADEEGTVVAVVDFESAIVAIPRHHTASNPELWLEPNTPAIPPVGTPCVLIIRPGPWRLQLDRTGRLFLGGKPIALGAAGEQLRTILHDTPDARVQLEVVQGCPTGVQARVKAMLDALGIKATQRTTTQPSAATEPTTKASSDDDNDQPNDDNTALLRWAAGQLSNDHVDSAADRATIK